MHTNSENFKVKKIITYVIRRAYFKIETNFKVTQVYNSLPLEQKYYKFQEKNYHNKMILLSLQFVLLLKCLQKLLFLKREKPREVAVYFLQVNLVDEDHRHAETIHFNSIQTKICVLKTVMSKTGSPSCICLYKVNILLVGLRMTTFLKTEDSFMAKLSISRKEHVFLSFIIIIYQLMLCPVYLNIYFS